MDTFVALLIFEFTERFNIKLSPPCVPVGSKLTTQSVFILPSPVTPALVAVKSVVNVGVTFENDIPANSSIPYGAAVSPKSSDADFKSNVAVVELPSSSFISPKDIGCPAAGNAII